MQNAYVAYQEEIKNRTLDATEKDFMRRQLGQELEKLGVEHKALRVKGERPYFYIGIRLRSEVRQGSADITEYQE